MAGFGITSVFDRLGGVHRRAAAALCVAVALSLGLSDPAQAQSSPPATLVADDMTMTEDGRIVAEGNVEVLYRGERLRARRITYNRANDTIDIEGPVTLITEDGSVIEATDANFDTDFEQGILESARIVLDEQMQIAAVEAHRENGRYNQLYKAVASSCRVCKDGPPLWQIRARRMVQDTEEKQLYFYDAYFDVGGVPVLYLPRLRLPDPSLKRATGFLFPSYRNSAILGPGVKVPYFIVLNPHSDLTFTPYIAQRTRTAELRYRRAFRTGDIEINGAVSSDDIMPGQLRYYVDGDGRFSLPYDFTLRFGIEVASDNTYASEYGYSGSDALTNSVTIERVRRFEFIEVGARSELPLARRATAEDLRGRVRYERRILPAAVGGEVGLAFDLEVPGNNSGPYSFHGHGETGWRRDWVLGGGLLGAVEGQVVHDYYVTRPGTGMAPTLYRVTPSAGAELRWPLARTTRNGGREVLEPLLQLAWTETGGPFPVNEDSGLAEFDEGNLISMSRFPGYDMQEMGTRIAAGANWTRFAAGGARYSLTAGRVLRFQNLGQFTPSSGLDGPTSDWLLAAALDVGIFDLSGRTIFDDGFTFNKSATRAGLDWDRLSLSSTHLWQIADPAEGRPVPLHEVFFRAGYEFNRHWTGAFDTRYDFTASQFSQSGVQMIYNNECLQVGLSWTRRNVLSTISRVDNTFGVTVGLNGVGNDGRPYRRACRG